MKSKKVQRYTKLNKNRYNRKKYAVSSGVIWKKAPDIQKNIKELILISKLPFKSNNITCLRSYNSKSRAYARIWGLSKVWQISLKIKPHYVIEVLSEKYDGLSKNKKDEVLFHELAHIPMNFSGSLLPHIKHGKRNFKNRVDRLIKSLKYK